LEGIAHDSFVRGQQAALDVAGDVHSRTRNSHVNVGILFAIGKVVTQRDVFDSEVSADIKLSFAGIQFFIIEIQSFTVGHNDIASAFVPDVLGQLNLITIAKRGRNTRQCFKNKSTRIVSVLP
jgi:hypothetical protein